MKDYITIQTEERTAEYVTERSRFIAAAIHVDTAEEAARFVEAKRKKYFDATHNCYAYIAGNKAKFSDDGEPQGTAGMPIYECIRQNDLDFTCVVVTRYFGGIKLGAGGLTRAYSTACSDALKLCDRLRVTDCILAQIEVDYSMLKTLRNALRDRAREQAAFFEDKVRLLYLFPADLSTTIADIVSQNTLGKGVFEVLEHKSAVWN